LTFSEIIDGWLLVVVAIWMRMTEVNTPIKHRNIEEIFFIINVSNLTYFLMTNNVNP